MANECAASTRLTWIIGGTAVVSGTTARCTRAAPVAMPASARPAALATARGPDGTSATTPATATNVMSSRAAHFASTTGTTVSPSANGSHAGTRPTRSTCRAIANTAATASSAPSRTTSLYPGVAGSQLYTTPPEATTVAAPAPSQSLVGGADGRRRRSQRMNAS